MAETDLHRQLMMNTIFALTEFLRNRTAYVSGNNFVYYHEGDNRRQVSPDCYVVFDVEMRPRDSYMTWKEGGRTPDVVFEFTSKATQAEDIAVKRPIYQDLLCVKEYFMFDPTGDYLHPRLRGYRLRDGVYQDIELASDRMYSEQLDLELVIHKETMRLFEPSTGQWVITPEEYWSLFESEAALRRNLEREMQEQARLLEQERQRAEAERQRAEAERQRAEAERQRAEAERQKADLLEIRLRALEGKQ